MPQAHLFQLPEPASVPVTGEAAHYPVHRIFCVGRNYAEHAQEMGFAPDREAPFYFTKPASAIVHSGATIPFPLGTENLHYEMELVVAIGAPAFRISKLDATETVYGYATGLDLTRRDLQVASREKGRPWDFGKAFEDSAPIGAITTAAEFGAIGEQRISLAVNGETRQDATLSQMIWSVPELISFLSRYYHLVPGDLIYTGTPAGVGKLAPGDSLRGEIDGLAPIDLQLGPLQ
ncbi:fumarylacetoacetate hydrolase family protein [Mangrovibrevibacter kandeliae]|uniref:fumarylacetoacetate hydrolase family protein n=1 Tax=Mangrovibrevibacter kandeliae TaxID=2968473 RepID=UPI002117A813|nr:fumarylacetoacetate hydrolase family protein [Aurantimonas sp. CSK15Z-1]MCQ8781821.1 fumarylacetoacetate hydrolase family protein [Aurantimonas sp. CSK15Z-1]